MWNMRVVALLVVCGLMAGQDGGSVGAAQRTRATGGKPQERSRSSEVQPKSKTLNSSFDSFHGGRILYLSPVVGRWRDSACRLQNTIIVEVLVNICCFFLFPTIVLFTPLHVSDSYGYFDNYDFTHKTDDQPMKPDVGHQVS